ncbi:neisseria PilC protein [mine drainage metagenome]|uniref:Neisseria PilC protein n=1 Tax=mine drainage metagenome TaxID=410659 RepID=A0A1J5QMY3_9ZZZZ
MNMPFRNINGTYVAGAALRFLARAAIVALALPALGTFPPAGATTIDQSPLIIAKPLPPNIVLMLDDSGSMAWDTMPDYGYLTSTDLVKGMRNSAVNGVYYNPTITYLPPPKVDGSLYPANPVGNFPKAYQDPASGDTSFQNLTSMYSYMYVGNYFKYYDKNGDNRAFAFTVQNGATYTNYHVSADCSGFTNCYPPTDTSGLLAPAGVQAGTNILNWFSYYATRIKMAKSGLMTAFSGIDTTYRIGFGSIDGGNVDALPAPLYTYTDNYNGGDNSIAGVQTYGNGSSGTQKSNFWNWLIGETASGGTPLRQALKAVGNYYQTAQPWKSVDANGTTQQYTCRQSYVILTTDGFWNESSSDVAVGEVDGVDGATLGANADGSISGPNAVNFKYLAKQPFTDGATASSNVSNTLADVAMYFWKNDLCPSGASGCSLANEVPTSSEDPAFWQHMTTFTVGLGFTPQDSSGNPIDVNAVFNWANGGAAIPGFSWPKPAANSINNIADLVHAAVNGHGGFYSVKNPKEFAQGIANAIKRISQRVGTGSSLAANSTKLDSGTYTYQAVYYTGQWKGDLKAFAVDPATKQIATNPTWVASAQLPAAGSRTIVTFNPTTGKAVSFTSPSNLSATQDTALGSTATQQQTMIDYLRGDASQEEKNGGTLRDRDTPLGDIVDSQPVYVGAPNPNLYSGKTFTGASSYGTFASDNTSRTPVIYVAANDGMLHGFNATTGVEVYAYLPSAVILGGLSKLADPDYGSNTIPHQYFNDGELTVADAYWSGHWHTVLVGTTGRGSAKAVYALDVTDPGNITLLWEHSAADGAANSNTIGQMTGKPLIIQTATGWTVLVGNGYNSATNTASLLQFDLKTGSLTVHATDATTANGLAAPASIDSDGDGIQDYAYAGDLDGRVWKFDLTSASSSGSLLFTATDASGNAQPITAGMLVGMDPATSNIWLFFGTGKYLSTNDLSDKSVQTWYGIIAGSSNASLVSNLSNGRSALVQRSIMAETPASGTTLAARGFSLGTANDMKGKSGWYLDLVSPVNGKEGERMSTPNQFQGGVVLGTSRIPDTSDVCNPTGRGWIMALDPFTGTNVTKPFFDVNGDGVVNGSDVITGSDGTTYPAGGIGFDSAPNNPIFVSNTMLTSTDSGKSSAIQTSGGGASSGRVSWRELVNQ